MEISEILGLLQGRLVGIQIHRNIVKDVTKTELERLSEFIERNEVTESDILQTAYAHGSGSINML